MLGARPLGLLMHFHSQLAKDLQQIVCGKSGQTHSANSFERSGRQSSKESKGTHALSGHCSKQQHRLTVDGVQQVERRDAHEEEHHQRAHVRALPDAVAGQREHQDAVPVDVPSRAGCSHRADVVYNLPPQINTVYRRNILTGEVEFSAISSAPDVRFGLPSSLPLCTMPHVHIPSSSGCTEVWILMLQRK
jgi:hypothetical protein